MQGDPAKTVMYIQDSAVKLTVVNDTGKEAVVAILGPRNNFTSKVGIFEFAFGGERRALVETRRATADDMMC